MRRLRFRHPSPALVVSVVALFVALGGTSYAAFSIPRSSVGNKQLKDNSVSNSKLRNGSVSNAKLRPGSVSGTNIKNGTITGANLNLSALGTVPSATNAINSINATNSTNATTAGALAAVSYQKSAPKTSPGCGTTPCTLANFTDTEADVTCPAGTVVSGGGVQTSSGGVEINESEPALSTPTAAAPDQWVAFVDNFTPNDHTFSVYAICIKANAANNPGVVSKHVAAQQR